MCGEHKNKTKIILIAIVLVILLSGCSSDSLEKIFLESKDWSRGVLLGETSMASPVELVVDEGFVYSVLFHKKNQESELIQPELVILNQSGEIHEKIPLDYQILQPRQSKLILAEDGFDLFWIDSHQLKSIQISKTGEILSDIRTHSGNESVSNFEVIPWKSEYIIWYGGNRNDPGLYALIGSIDHFQKTSVDPQGIRINLFLDEEEHLHASWARYPQSYGEVEFYYLLIDSKTPDLKDVIKVYSKGISPAVRIDGPVYGMDQELSYIFWSEAVVSGLDAGTRTTFYQYFPIGKPETIRPPMVLFVPAVQSLDQVPFPAGMFQAGNRVRVGRTTPGIPALENINPISTQFSETAIVFRSRSEYKWRDYRNQVNVAYLSDGLVTSYQPLSYTSAESYYPSIVFDAEGDLYISWLEKGEVTYRVYLTTTDSDKKYLIDQVSLQDYLYLGAEGLFGILAGAVLSPFAAAVWGGAGLLAFIFNIVLSQFHKPTLRTVGEVLSMIGGVVIFWLVKYTTLPGLKDGYVPFSAWIPRIPPNWETPLVIGVPVLIGALSIFVAWWNTYGKKSGSPIYFHLIYCGMDALLSCAIYGIMIYGSF